RRDRKRVAAALVDGFDSAGVAASAYQTRIGDGATRLAAEGDDRAP
ncbi:homoserine kinase, partial [Halobacterium salinarum]|nr:homoserine kinase [Halobacterium salinarum]